MKHPNPPQTHASPWFSLAPRWQSGVDEIPGDSPVNDLSTAFKLILLGDGSTTRNLQLVTGEATAIDVIAMSPQTAGLDAAPEFIAQIPLPRLRRQVWLRTASGQRLAYAVSWWPTDRAEQFLLDRTVPIWTSLATSKTELYRDVQKIVYGDSINLSREFQCEGPLWGRYYFFRHQGQALTLIHEIFSSNLSGI